MANNQTNRRKRDIKTKLMAAVCMLLVSSIMMVSSTYAWFTLSTAPEVKGITTAVGANGNLEMALLPKNGTMPGNSATGDGALAIEERNVTWGNLVDLSDSEIYGLDQITLFPSALNWDASTKVLAASFLKTPAYGADGRVSQLLENTVAGYYDPADGFVPNDFYGVRAVGTASGMTPRQLDYRNARAAGNNATAYAKTLASQSLSNNGSALANIAMAHGLADDEATESYTQTDVAALKAIVGDLETRILPQIEASYLQYILAYAASAAGDDTKWNAVKGVVNADNATLDSVIARFGGTSALPSALSTAIDKYNATKAAVAAATVELSGLSTAEDATFTWEQISSPMQKLVDTNKMKVNNLTIGAIVEDPNRLVSSVLGGGGLELTMETGAGVYADIADQCGDFTASITIAKVEYNSIINLENVTARMATKTAVNPVYLAAISTAVEAAGAPAGGAVGSMPITDMYGYIIDLAFRTNAADSDLLLQVEETDRIYSDNTNDETMGGGSSMTFKATTTDFTDAQVKELMKAIRIVFFHTEGKEVIANAKLAADTANLTSDGWKADMYLYSVAANGTETPEDNVIMPLTQNTPTALSVLVYLDGNSVGNDDVAATAATSMTGSMNIQFASSANLVPMEYASLHQGTGNNTPGGGDVSQPDEPAVTP